MPKKKSPSYVTDEDGVLYAVNRVARRRCKKYRHPHTPITDIPLTVSRFGTNEKMYFKGEDRFIPPYQPAVVNKSKY